jgi:hypothetical protein
LCDNICQAFYFVLFDLFAIILFSSYNKKRTRPPFGRRAIMDTYYNSHEVG